MDMCSDHRHVSLPVKNNTDRMTQLVRQTLVTGWRCM